MALKLFKKDTFLLQGLALNSCLTHTSERRNAPLLCKVVQSLHVLCVAEKGHCMHLSPNFSQLLG